jgi:hypothetical protein
VVTITISDELKSRVPGLALGCVTAEVPSVAEHDEVLWREIDSHLARQDALRAGADHGALGVAGGKAPPASAKTGRLSMLIKSLPMPL